MLQVSLEEKRGIQAQLEAAFRGSKSEFEKAKYYKVCLNAIRTLLI